MLLLPPNVTKFEKSRQKCGCLFDIENLIFKNTLCRPNTTLLQAGFNLCCNLCNVTQRMQCLKVTWSYPWDLESSFHLSRKANTIVIIIISSHSYFDKGSWCFLTALLKTQGGISQFCLLADVLSFPACFKFSQYSGFQNSDFQLLFSVCCHFLCFQSVWMTGSNAS